MTDTREHDAFGPWVDEVRTAEDVPRLFRDHRFDPAAARLVLKVPRPIARRDATADMDLYDHLLVLGADGLTVLSRHPDDGGARGYRTREVAFADVAAVLDEVDLLDGRFSVHTRDGQVLSVACNGSARDGVRRLVDGLRTATAGPGRPAPPAAPPGDLTPTSLGPLDVAVVADVREASQGRPDLVVLAWNGRQVVRPRATGPAGVLRHVAHLLSPTTVQAVVVAGDGDHLEVFGRRDRLVRGRRPVHSASRLVVPLRGLDAVRASPDPRWAGTTELVLRAGRARLGLTVPDSSPVPRALAGLASGRR